MSKRLLAALHLAALSGYPSIKIAPAKVAVLRQHPSLRLGKSGVAAAKRAAKKRKRVK